MAPKTARAVSPRPGGDADKKAKADKGNKTRRAASAGAKERPAGDGKATSRSGSKKRSNSAAKTRRKLDAETTTKEARVGCILALAGAMTDSDIVSIEDSDIIDGVVASLTEEV